MAFKRFLRKEEPWPKFVYDRTRDGWELLEDVGFTSIDPGKLELVQFLEQGETIIVGTEMARRAKELRANLGQRHAEFLLEHQAKIPKEFRKYYLVFTGTKWRGPDGRLGVAYLYWRGGQWVLYFGWLESDWSSVGRLPRLRE